jgi:hypothetical protein
MLDPRKNIITDIESNHPWLQELLKRPAPKTAVDFLKLEQEAGNIAMKIADQIMITHLIKAHHNKEFVASCIANSYKNSPCRLRNKGWKETSIMFRGGTRIVLRTPYLRADYKGKRGRPRNTRGNGGSGIYPVLEFLGISDGVSPATKSDLSLLLVQTASYEEACDILKRRGFECDPSTLVRIATRTAEADISLRDAALSAAMNTPIPVGGPLAGKRVRISIDGGRVRTRLKKRRGRKNKKGRHGFSVPWKEPRILVIDILDAEGKCDPLRFPLYDTCIDNADAAFSLLIGYLRLLGAAHAQVVEFIADGAEWIWDRVDQLTTAAEIPEAIFYKVLDFYHASEHLATAVELVPHHTKKERQKLYKKLRHDLRHNADGVGNVITRLTELGKLRQDDAMNKALSYFENHHNHMNYKLYDEMKLPVGSGQVESAVRRVINLRFKSPGSFWNLQRAEIFLHLRAYYKAGRWDELISRVIQRHFDVPTFEAIGQQQQSDPGVKNETKDSIKCDKQLPIIKSAVDASSNDNQVSSSSQESDWEEAA